MKSKIVKNICIVSIGIVLFIYLSIWANSSIYKNKMSFFSYKIYVMSYDIAESDINSGDLVIVKSIKNEDINENDKIVYEIDGSMAVEEVKGTDNEGGNVNLIVENDEILLRDGLEGVKILGKVVKNIKGLGNLALFMQSPIGILDVLIIIICIFIIIGKISKNINAEKSYSSEKNDSTKEQ